MPMARQADSASPAMTSIWKLCVKPSDLRGASQGLSSKLLTMKCQAEPAPPFWVAALFNKNTSPRHNSQIASL
jgi:hypothetical protein